ncbi:MAG: hypothetical protein A3H44_03635 [Gammaproteobacteria bacterium RIFCSPLOWO2_02_FULL_57_10]|nr:MAG: hypothetical protein A3H44_03635 [Gammaproteobacteria bacterium RIFCSPLOWO2_02_FULL_57_10]
MNRPCRDVRIEDLIDLLLTLDGIEPSKDIPNGKHLELAAIALHHDLATGKLSIKELLNLL